MRFRGPLALKDMDEFRSEDTEGILQFLVRTAYAIFADHRRTE